MLHFKLVCECMYTDTYQYFILQMPIQNFQTLQTLSRKFGGFHCLNTIINPGWV